MEFTKVEGVIKKKLSKLEDDTIFDYIQSILTSEELQFDVEDEDDEIVQQVSQLLLSCEYCEEEEEASRITIELLKEIAALSSNGNSKEADTDTPVRLLDAPMNLGGDNYEEIEQQNNYLLKGDKANDFTLTNKNTLFTGTEVKSKKVSKRKQRRAAKRADNDETNDDKELDIQIQLMNVNTIHDGDNCSDVHLANFDLPHKGDGDMLLDNANLVLARGRHYGLIGKNGVGKTTFMESFAARKLHKLANQSVLLVKQEIPGDERSCFQTVLEADNTRVMLEKEIELIKSSGEDAKDVETKVTALQLQIQNFESSIGTKEADARAILHGMGFDKEMQDKATNQLSGGWRMRVALACALFINPSILLLDEPTNHLDLEACIWLEDYLTSESFTSTLAIVSHDRFFLDKVVTDIVHFDNHTLTCYRGNYFTFEQTLEQRRIQRKRLLENQEAKRKHLQEYITKHAQAGENGPKAARQRKSKMKKLERLGMEAAAEMQGKKYQASYDGELQDVTMDKEDEPITLVFPAPSEVKGEFIKLDSVQFQYKKAAKLLLKDMSLRFDMSSRVALLGKNGSGKSTFIKLLLGKLEPTGGFIIRNQTVRFGYMSQNSVEMLDIRKTPLELLLHYYPGNSSSVHVNHMRRYLATFGMKGELPMQVIRTLSGGEKVRVCLALICYNTPHFLILDEPSNHLDFDTLNALIDAVKSFKGGCLIVSHDESLLTSVCKDLFVCENSTVSRFDGDFAAYKKQIIKARRSAT